MRGARSESSRCERYNLRVEPTAYGGGSRTNPLGNIFLDVVEGGDSHAQDMLSEKCILLPAHYPPLCALEEV
jgi:hypothetical protein